MTETLSIIGSGGYADLTAWQTARVGSAGSGDTEIAEMKDQTFTGSFILSGWAAGVTLIIRAQNPHGGDYSLAGGGVLLQPSTHSIRVNNTAAITVRIQDFVIDTTLGTQQGVRITVGGSTVYVERCLCKSTSTISSIYIQDGTVGTTTLNIDRCVFSGGYSFGSRAIAALCNATIRGCTFDSSPMLLNTSASCTVNIDALGCIILGTDTVNSTSASSTLTATYCIATSFSAQWDTLSNTSTDIANVMFTDDPGLDYSLVDDPSNIAIDFVASGTMPTEDVLGNAQSGGVWDCGAYEVQQVVGNDPMTAANRTSGVAPLAVQFSALSGSGMVAPGGGENYADLSYAWNFGTGVSGTYTHSGRRKRYAGNFLAACVFENPGTHTVTCTVTETDGTQTTYEETITVTDPDTVFAGNTYYIDATGGNDSNAGTSAGAAWQTLTKAETELLGENGTYRILLKRGESWSTSTITVGNFTGPKFIGAYGTGAKPSVASTAGTVFEVLGDDTTIVGLDVDGSVIASGSGGQAIRLDGDRGTVHQCDVVSGSHSFKTPAATVVDVCISECTSDAEDYGIFVQDGMTGITFIGNTWTHTESEHHIRCYSAQTLITDDYFGTIGNVTKNAIKMVGDTIAIGDNVIAHNVFRTACNWQISVGPENVSSEQYLDRVLIVANKFRNAVSTCIHVALDNDCWIRNNIFEDGTVTCVTIDERYTGIVPTGVEVENNTAHRSSAGNRTLVSVITASDSPIVRNNILFCESGTATIASGTATASNNLTTDPDFTDSANYDYTLVDGSGAINTGASNNIRQDLLLGVRPTGAGRDIGAYEFGAAYPWDSEPASTSIIRTGLRLGLRLGL